MHVDYLIVGQGISGTWLSYYLAKEKKSFVVVDDENMQAPSRIAAGIINPVTGRRHVEVWMAKELIPFAWNAYIKMGKELGITAISQKKIIDFFPSPQMRQSFVARIEEQNIYMHHFPHQDELTTFFHIEFGCGEIRPVYTAHLEKILPAWRKQLTETGCLMAERFDQTKLMVEKDRVLYKDIIAGKIIFCDGNSSIQHPYFELLPFAPNKGELLILSIPGLPANMIYKKGLMMVPLAEKDQWWVGSSYEWEFEDAAPGTAFLEKTASLLKSWLKVPFIINEQQAGIRPATLERRPFVGLHPIHSSIGILNGMGTKGCSLAPFFAKQLADHLVYGKPIEPEADIARFSKILSRNFS